MGHPGHADEALDKLQHCALSLLGQKPGLELGSNAVRVQITRENCLLCSVWHINDCSNVLNGSPTNLIRKPPNCFHIFRCWARGSSPLISRRLRVMRVPLLKRACHSKHLTRLMVSFPYARLIIPKVPASDLTSFMQNLMFAVCSSVTCMLKSQMWRHTWWQKLVLCNSQSSHSDTTRHTEWRRSLLPSTAHAFTYCHWLAFYGTSLETFW